MWGDHPREVETPDEEELWETLLDDYGGSDEEDALAAAWDDAEEEGCAEAGLVASPIIPLEESTPDELCRSPPPPSGSIPQASFPVPLLKL